MNSGKYPIDPTTPVGLVRLQLGDTDPSDITGTAPNQIGNYLWYSDDELTALIAARGDSTDATTVFILRLIAMTPAMLLKKFTSTDLAVDGPAITEALLKAAKDIESGMAATDALAASEFFKVVNTGPTVSQPYNQYGYPDYESETYDLTIPQVL